MRSRLEPLLGAILLSTSIACIAGACGGGADRPLLIVTLASEPSRDGNVRNDGTVLTAGGAPFTGDIDASTLGVYGRQFFSFFLEQIPPGALIESALLRLDQQAVSGSPYLSHGALLLEHVDFGPSLDAGDFDVAPLSGGLVLAPNATVGLKTLDVTALLQADLAAGRRRAQFRLRFATLTTDTDGENDCAFFADAENSVGGGTVPILEIRLRP
jgi:hypothetical protein